MPKGNHKNTFVCFMIFLFFLSFSLHTSAQDVPISFDEYHGYTGTAGYLERVSQAYPDITELMEIGKSSMGRPILVLVISNMDNGVTLDRFIELRNMRKEGVENVPPLKSFQGKLNSSPITETSSWLSFFTLPEDSPTGPWAPLPTPSFIPRMWRCST
jgi:hypothetical protein